GHDEFHPTPSDRLRYARSYRLRGRHQNALLQMAGSLLRPKEPKQSPLSDNNGSLAGQYQYQSRSDNLVGGACANCCLCPCLYRENSRRFRLLISVILKRTTGVARRTTSASTQHELRHHKRLAPYHLTTFSEFSTWLRR